MSGVYIRGMEMPSSCMDCPFKGFDRAGGRGNICTISESITLHAVLDGVDVTFVRMGDCPLIPIPPHGRLIDADELKTAFPCGESVRTECVRATIDHAPTIIPTEEVE